MDVLYRFVVFFFSSRRRHTRWTGDWSSDVCSSDLLMVRTREHLGVTGVVVTHDMRSAYTVGDRIAMLYEGKVRQVGTVAEIQETEDPVVRQFIEGRPA